MKLDIERRILDTLNGALNKQLIDNFKVIRRVDGSELSETEIMRLTRPYFRAAGISEMPTTPAESNELHWDETPEQKQFSGTIRMAAKSSDEVEAARCFVGTIYPMCNAVSESPDGKSMSLYNSDQMIVAFVAGQQWLRDRCAKFAPLDTLTLEGAMNLLWRFLTALPEDWTVENAIKFMLEYNKNKRKEE